MKCIILWYQINIAYVHATEVHFFEEFKFTFLKLRTLFCARSVLMRFRVGPVISFQVYLIVGASPCSVSLSQKSANNNKILGLRPACADRAGNSSHRCTPNVQGINGMNLKGGKHRVSKYTKARICFPFWLSMSIA